MITEQKRIKRCLRTIDWKPSGGAIVKNKERELRK